jgi:hypothetical protein
MNDVKPSGSKILNFITSRLVCFILGIVIAVVGVISPKVLHWVVDKFSDDMEEVI